MNTETKGIPCLSQAHLPLYESPICLCHHNENNPHLILLPVYLYCKILLIHCLLQSCDLSLHILVTAVLVSIHVQLCAYLAILFLWSLLLPFPSTLFFRF